MKKTALIILSLIFGLSLLSVSGCAVVRVKERNDVHHKHKDKDRDDRYEHEDDHEGDHDHGDKHRDDD